MSDATPEPEAGEQQPREPAAPAQGALSLWLPPVLYLAAIYWVSSAPQPMLAPPGGWDKVFHALAYAVLGALLCRACRGSGLGGAAALALAILIASLYGASDEWHQSFVPNRFADPRDWVADTLGACAGAGAWLWLRGWRTQASIR